MSGLEMLAAGAALASGAVGAVGSIAQGNAAQSNANFQAAQLEQQGKDELAVATRKAADEKRKTDSLLSRQTAVAAASGGGVENSTILSLLGDTEAQGDYNARTQIYSGQAAQYGANLQAESARQSGRAAAKGSRFKAAGTLISGVGSAFKAYNDASNPK